MRRFKLSILLKVCLSAGRMVARSDIHADIQSLVGQSIADGMAIRSVTVAGAEVVYFKGVVEANAGVAQVFAQPRTPGSTVADRLALTVVAAANASSELDRLLDDLQSEIELTVVDGQPEWSRPQGSTC